MIIERLIKAIEVKEIVNEKSFDVLGLTDRDGDVREGYLFVCINGLNDDGHLYAENALFRGARALVVERKLNVDACQIVVSDARSALSKMAACFYGYPSQKMKIVGVTGTNGKTTTAHLTRAILARSGKNVGLIGTRGIFYAGYEIAPSLTTPDPLELQKTLADMLNFGVQYVVMEVSAHALSLRKTDGIQFDIGIFTNLSQDHLDYFGDIETYKRAKESFFLGDSCKLAIVNADDETGREIISARKGATVSYGIENPSDVFAIDITERNDGTEYIINLLDAICDIELKLIGRYNVYNSMAASTAALALRADLASIREGLKETVVVSGRMEKIAEYNGATIYVDYAHTPDGLEKSLKVLKNFATSRVMCLFGCGGNRDRGKRAIMGAISGALADFTVITSDNPRYEDPHSIILDIENGIKEQTKSYITIQDRANAIEYVLGLLGTGDVLLIAGKGDEKYQEVLGIKHEYNDKNIVAEYMSARQIIGL